jgi:hypothetical protein
LKIGAFAAKKLHFRQDYLEGKKKNYACMKWANLKLLIWVWLAGWLNWCSM